MNIEQGMCLGVGVRSIRQAGSKPLSMISGGFVNDSEIFAPLCRGHLCRTQDVMICHPYDRLF